MHPPPLVAKRRDRVLSVLLTILSLIFDRSSRLSNPRQVPSRIVILKPCCLGDVLLTTPVIRAIKDTWPDARLTYAVGPWSAPAIATHPDIASRLNMSGVGDGPFRIRNYVRVFRALRAGRFDLAIVLDRSSLICMLPWLSGIPVRAGIDSAGRGFALNIRVPWRAVVSEKALFLAVASAAGASSGKTTPEFFISDADSTAAIALLNAETDSMGKYVALAPGGGKNPGMTLIEKRWPIERFTELANVLTEHYHRRVLLVGGESDTEIASRIAENCHAGVLNLTGQLAFGQLGAVLSQCQLFVGNDSGPMHLAVAVGVPTIAIFGPTEPVVYGHTSPTVVNLRGTSSMLTADVTVGEVVAAVENLLHESPR